MRNTIRLVHGIFLLLLLSGPAQPAFADAETLIITGFEAPPYLHTNDNGDPIGLLVDHVREASEASGVPVRFVVTNWPRAQLEVRKGSADLIFPVVHTPERDAWLDYPADPTVRFAMSIFAHEDAAFDFSGNTADLHGLRIGKIAQGRMHPKFRALEESGKAIIEPRDNVNQLITAVKHKRLDAFVAPLLMTLWTADDMKVRTVQPFAEPIGVSNIYLAFSKKSPKQEAWKRLQASLTSLEPRKSRFIAALSR